jgi:hypothetical protein
LPIVRVPGNGREPHLSERQLHARRRVHEAMAALGGSAAPRAHASGMWSGCSGACGSGRYGKAGAAGRCARSRRKEFSSRRSGCWRCT